MKKTLLIAMLLLGVLAMVFANGDGETSAAAAEAFGL